MMSLPIVVGKSRFIDDFADSCGWSSPKSINTKYKYFDIIESVKWESQNDWLPIYIKLKPEYEC